MGLTYSPYHVCQALTWAKSVELGNRWIINNPFGGDKVVVDLPVKTAYYCQYPWVYNESIDALVSYDLFVHVYDGRPIGPTETLCWEVSRRWGSTFSWMGIHDASSNFQPML